MRGAIAGRTRRRDLMILALAAGAHVVVLAALVLDARWTPVMVEPPIIQAELIRPDRSKPAPRPDAAARPAPPASSPAVAPAAHVPPTAPPRPAAPTGVVAPPGFTARQLVEETPETRKSLRDSLGCRHEKTAALTKAEKAACAEADGLRSRTAPLYAAIDPDKKAFFDGECDKDDEWCLYRVGKGPYPGIFALGKKKKHKGWAD